MISAYNSLITYNAENWEEYIDRLTLFDIFKDLIKAYPDKEDFTCVIKYILYAYSIESEMLVLGTDWLKNKQRIFEKANIKPRREIYEDLVHLKKKEVVTTIQRWLEWQDVDTFTQLQILKDLRVEMQVSCLIDIKKSSGEIDYDQKFKNAQYSVDLKNMVKDLESELIQTSPKLKGSIGEFKEARKKNSFGLETMLKEQE